MLFENIKHRRTDFCCLECHNGFNKNFTINSHKCHSSTLILLKNGKQRWTFPQEQDFRSYFLKASDYQECRNRIFYHISWEPLIIRRAETGFLIIFTENLWLSGEQRYIYSLIIRRSDGLLDYISWKPLIIRIFDHISWKPLIIRRADL